MITCASLRSCSAPVKTKAPGDITPEVNIPVSHMDHPNVNSPAPARQGKRPLGCFSCLRPLIDRNDFLADGLADILTQRAVKAIVFQLFKHVCTPAGATGNGKNRCEEIGWNT